MASRLLQKDLLRIEPLRGPIGAMIEGITLAEITEEHGEPINQALHEHGVLFHRPGPDAPVSPDELARLGACFGELYDFPYGDMPKEHKNIGYIDNTSDIQQNREYCWHSDGTPEPCPPGAAILNICDVPDSGGDTMWSSMYLAFEALAPQTQLFLECLEALHSTDAMARKMGPGIGKKIFGEGRQTTHPVVITDPLTGRKALYVNENYTDRLVGLSLLESESILQMLFRHINNPEFHVRCQWQLNDIAIWEQRVTH